MHIFLLSTLCCRHDNEPTLVSEGIGNQTHLKYNNGCPIVQWTHFQQTHCYKAMTAIKFLEEIDGKVLPWSGIILT